MNFEDRIMQSIPCPFDCDGKFVIREHFYGDSVTVCKCPKCHKLVYVGY